MANPIMQQLTSRRMPGNPLAMIAEFRKFAQGITPEQAQQQVQQLLNSGKMSQAQFEQLKQRANEFIKFLK